MLSEKIKELRIEKRMTQAELASLAGIEEKDIQDIEGSVYTFWTVALENKISTALGDNILPNDKTDAESIVEFENSNARRKKYHSLMPDQQRKVDLLIDYFFRHPQETDIVNVE